MIDLSSYLSVAQVITATAASTNVMDELIARDIGAGNALQLNVHGVAAFATLTSLQIAWQTSVDNVTFYDEILSPVIAVANLVANTPLFRCVLPPRGWNQPSRAPARYYRLNYTVAGSNATTGTVNAWISALPDQDQVYFYPRNYTAP